MKEFNTNNNFSVEELRHKLEIATGLEQRFELLQALTIKLLNFHDDKLAEQYNIQALNAAQELGNQVKYARSLVFKGVILNQRAEYNKALDVLYEALKLARELGSKGVESIALNNLSSSYGYLENQPKTFEYALESLKINRECGYRESEARSLHNIGVLYFDIGEYTKAITHIEQSYAIKLEFGNKNEISMSLNLLGIVHYKLGDVDKAIECWTKALKSTRDTAYEFGESRVLMNLADIYFTVNRLDKVGPFLERALEIAKRLNDTNALVYALIKMGNFFYKLNEIRQAVEQYCSALDAAINTNEKSSIIKAHNGLSKCYRRLERFDLALHHCEKAHAVEKEKFTLEKDRRIRQLNVQYEVEKTQREKDAVELQSKLIRTKNNELERALQKVQSLNDQLVISYKQKNDVIGVVAHDLRSPLSGIAQFCRNTAAQYQNTSKRDIAHNLAHIKDVSAKILSIVANLLDVHMLEQGKLNLAKEKIDICNCIQDVISRYRASAAKKDISFTEKLPATPLFAVADPRAITQILDNLVSNAVKFSPQNKNITIKAQECQTALRIEIEDQGPGFDQNELKKLFTEYAKLSAKPTGSETTTGLGLWIVKQLTEALNGAVKCTSAPHRGAVFTVELPVYEDH